ncbi:MAG: type III pantothenate kinase [Bacteroidaceae bacterium]|nr:type III pantothenate kinase [Bacteroidaceae bacterium]
MKLLIDIGNTSAKLAVMDTDIVHFERRYEPWKETFTRLMATFSIDDVRLSTVAGEDVELKEALVHLDIPVIWLTSSVLCPVKPVAGVPPTYGADRWAADIGAIAQDPDHTLLIIDAGTCITYDLFSADGRLLGGAISPGVQLRLNAMHEHTALLPQVEAENESAILGHDTRTHMLSAAVNGARFEIEGYIRQFMKEYPDLHVFITGGNTFDFAEDITCPVTHDPYLVFRGLSVL